MVWASCHSHQPRHVAARQWHYSCGLVHHKSAIGRTPFSQQWSAMAIIDTLGYSKICARWVPQSLTTEHRRQSKAICSELLEHFDAEGEAFLSRIITGDETRAHHYEPEIKRQSMEWHRPQSPRKKKFKTTPSDGKLMITVFWDIDGAILVDVMAKGETINLDTYIKTLQKLKQRYWRLRPNRNPGDKLIQHDNASTHTSLWTQEAIVKFGWTVLTHPPYSPDLAPSDFHLFGPLKDALRGTRLEMMRAWLMQWGHGYVKRKQAGTGKACMPLFHTGVRPKT